MLEHNKMKIEKAFKMLPNARQVKQVGDLSVDSVDYVVDTKETAYRITMGIYEIAKRCLIEHKYIYSGIELKNDIEDYRFLNIYYDTESEGDKYDK